MLNAKISLPDSDNMTFPPFTDLCDAGIKIVSEVKNRTYLAGRLQSVLGVGVEENPTEDNCAFKATAAVDAAAGMLTFQLEAVEDVDRAGDFHYDVG